MLRSMTPQHSINLVIGTLPIQTTRLTREQLSIWMFKEILVDSVVKNIFQQLVTVSNNSRTEQTWFDSPCICTKLTNAFEILQGTSISSRLSSVPQKKNDEMTLNKLIFFPTWSKYYSFPQSYFPLQQFMQHNRKFP